MSTDPRTPTARIHAALKARGLTRLADLIAQTPIDVPWDEIVKDVLGDDKAMASSTLTAAALAECRTDADREAFVRAWLARHVHAGLPESPARIVNLSFSLAEPWRDRVFDTLLALRDAAPAGWRPTGGEDPVLLTAWHAPARSKAAPRSPATSEPRVRVANLFSTRPIWEAVDDHLRRAGWSTAKVEGASDIRVEPWFRGGLLRGRRPSPPW